MGGHKVLCLSVLVLYFATANSYVIVVRVPDSSNSVDSENNIYEDIVIEEDSSKVLMENWYNWYNVAPSNENDTLCGTTDKDYKFFESTQSCYKIHTKRESWYDAEATCFREGGHLAVINSREEREILARQFPVGFRVVHIGLYWVQDYQIWMTTSGHTLAETGYAYGRVGEPNNINGDRHCGSMYPEGSFDNIACSDKTAFICEKIISFPPHQDTTTEANTELDTITDKIPDDSSEEQKSASTESSSEPTSVEALNECGTTDAEYIFYVNTQSCYKFHDEEATWHDAEATCVLEGGHLAASNSLHETDFLKTLFPRDSYTDPVFLGYHNDKGAWVPIQYWNKGEPNKDYGRDDCGVIFLDGTLADVACEEKNAFICQKNCIAQLPSTTEDQINDTTERNVADTSEEKEPSDMASISEPTPIETPVECDTTDSEYKFRKTTKKCYKTHMEQETWRDAKATCVREGGHLAVITDKEEMRFFMSQYPEAFTPVWLGFSRNNYSWKTVYGQTVAEAGFGNWTEGREINYDCGGMYSEGFIDGPCYGRTYFICEKNPNSQFLMDTTTEPEIHYETTETDTTIDQDDLLEVQSEQTSTEVHNECGTDTDYKFLESTKQCYRVHTDRAIWADAESTCVREGGHLAVINSQTEANFLMEYYPLGSYRVLLGFYRVGDSWVTIQGQSLSETGYENWNEGEPNNADGGQDCGSFYPEGTFDDIGCDVKLAFICEKNSNLEYQPQSTTEVQNSSETSNSYADDSTVDDVPDEESSGKEYLPESTFSKSEKECGTTDPEYIFYKSTGSCYKVHTDRAIWNDADATCDREGGHLAVINSQDEADILISLFPRRSYQFLLGFYFYTNWDSWLTIQGQPLSETGYESWNGGKPLIAGEDQDCGVMYRSGTFGSIECDMKMDFVCEKISNYKYQTHSTTEVQNSSEASDSHADDSTVDDVPDEESSGKEDLPESTLSKSEKECGTTDPEYIFYKSTGSCYKVHTDKATWDDAEATCDHEGGLLAVINSQNEADILISLFPRYSYQFFLGFRCHWDSWLTIQGETLSEAGYENWNRGKPNNADRSWSDCGFMYRDGTFGEIGCDVKMDFVCEKISNFEHQPQSTTEVQNSSKPSDSHADYYYDDEITLKDIPIIPDEESSGKEDLPESALSKSEKECGTTDPEYTFYKSTGSCYKVHTERATWNDAEETCVREGGHLAVINSQDEADILTTTSMHPVGVTHVFIGFSYREPNSPLISDMYEIRRNGVWLTVDGQTMAEAGYENWTPGEPNNAGGREYCGTIYGNGKFDDSACYNRFVYTCEIRRN